MDSASKGTSETSSSSTRPMADRLAQKGNGLDTARRFRYAWYSLVRRPGVQYHPNVTENGHSERGNPPDALTLG